MKKLTILFVFLVLAVSLQAAANHAETEYRLEPDDVIAWDYGDLSQYNVFNLYKTYGGLLSRFIPSCCHIENDMKFSGVWKEERGKKVFEVMNIYCSDNQKFNQYKKLIKPLLGHEIRFTAQSLMYKTNKDE